MNAKIHTAHLHFMGSRFQGSEMHPTPGFMSRWIERNMGFTEGTSADQSFNLGIVMEASSADRDAITFILRDVRESNVVDLNAGFNEAASAKQEIRLVLPELFGPRNWLFYRLNNAAYQVSDDPDEMYYLEQKNNAMAAVLEDTLAENGLVRLYPELHRDPMICDHLLTTFLDYKALWQLERVNGRRADIVSGFRPRLVVG